MGRTGMGVKLQVGDGHGHARRSSVVGRRSTVHGLALSNPDPEIAPDDALAAGAAFAADGRGVNNALAFPGLFKGALQARATRINNMMKIAAATTIARFAEQGELVPHILHKPMHEAVVEAVAQAAYRTGVVKHDKDIDA